VGLEPEHISLYGLSLDEGSRFMREAAAGRFSLPDDDLAAGMYERAVEYLGLHGYEQYEISNFAKPGFTCRHNLNYWNRGEYLGLGPGAWSFIGNRRARTMADLGEYGRRMRSGESAVAEEELLNNDQAAYETLMLGLRKTEGIALSAYELSFGPESLHARLGRLKQLQDAGLLTAEQGRLRLTRRGMLLSNEALSLLAA
jgi:oxygen-independent coproporphyrinogen-3 oxidase